MFREGHPTGPVLIVDRDPHCRQRVAAALAGREGPWASLQGREARDVLALAPEVGLVVLDADLPAGELADALAVLRERHPELPVLVVSDRPSDDELRRMVELGATSYIHKQASPDQLCSAIQAARLGHAVFETAALRPGVRRQTTLIERARAMDRAIIESLAAAVEAKDTVTSRHVHEVSQLAVVLARQIDPELAESEGFLFGCLLHDVGKIGVPETILNKPGPLDEAEWQIMRLHPETGERVIRPLGLDPTVSEIVLHHHERWDGTGYPFALAGEEIPLSARVFSVCDALEAMTAERPYRIPLAARRALAEVRAGAGSQFDPQVVAAFERCLADGVIEFGQPHEAGAVLAGRAA